MSDIRKKYRKYWISVTDPHENSCVKCDARNTEDCIKLGMAELKGCLSDRDGSKYRVFKLIKKGNHV